MIREVYKMGILMEKAESMANQLKDVGAEVVIV